VLSEAIVADFYKKVDALIKWLVTAVDPENVIVLSDHGFCALEGVVDINQVLSDEGLLTFCRTKSFLNALYRMLEEHGVKWKLLYRLGTQIYDRRKKGLGLPIVGKDTLAFCTSQLGSIRVNLRGRERFGVVDAKEYEAIRQRVIEILEKLPEVERVYKKEHLYDKAGPSFFEIDDLYVRFKGGMISSYWYGTKERGSHTMEGLLVRNGHDVEESGDVASIAEIARLACSVFGMSHEPELRARGAGYIGSEEEAELLRRLKQLGYL